MEPSASDIAGSSVDTVRERILSAAASLISQGGREAATTRAVAAAASVQAPTIYRLFGDKRGLLEAVAHYGLAKYMAEKAAREPHSDPVQELRDGWDMHIAFHLAHPGLFEILQSGASSPSSPVVEAGTEVLRGRIRRVALAGRLKVSQERALALIQSVGNGTVATLLSQPEEERDEGLAVTAREAVMTAICTEESAAMAGPNSAASMLRANLVHVHVLSAGERHLLEELLDRIANAEPSPEE